MCCARCLAFGFYHAAGIATRTARIGVGVQVNTLAYHVFFAQRATVIHNMHCKVLCDRLIAFKNGVANATSIVNDIGLFFKGGSAKRQLNGGNICFVYMRVVVGILKFARAACNKLKSKQHGVVAAVKRDIHRLPRV